MSVFTELLSVFDMDIDDTIEKEAHRIYLAAKLETIQENLQYLREACSLAVEQLQYMHSPFMFGYIEGMRKATAFVENRQINHLPRPTVWYNDPSFKTRKRAFAHVRRQVRRDITKLLWFEASTKYKYHLQSVDLSNGAIERLIRAQLRLALRSFAPMYKTQMQLKRRIEATGAKYEEVTNAKNVESWWS